MGNEILCETDAIFWIRQGLDGSKWVSKGCLQACFREAGLRDKGLADHLLKFFINSIADGHVLFRWAPLESIIIESLEGRLARFN